MAHTPGPWRIGPCEARARDNYRTTVVADNDKAPAGISLIADCSSNFADNPANAAFVVLACNVHGELLAACEATLPLLVLLSAKLDSPKEVTDTIAAVQAAITKAQVLPAT